MSMLRLSPERFAELQAKSKAVDKRIAKTGAATQQPTALEGMQALGRLKAGVMNKTEAAYAAHLESLKHIGKVRWYAFESMKFRLADNTFYTPDFAVLVSSGHLEMHEVKGFWQDDAKVKIKVAADKYPMRFIAIKAKAKKDGGGWAVEEF